MVCTRCNFYGSQLELNLANPLLRSPLLQGFPTQLPLVWVFRLVVWGVEQFFCKTKTTPSHQSNLQTRRGWVWTFLRIFMGSHQISSRSYPKAHGCFSNSETLTKNVGFLLVFPLNAIQTWLPLRETPRRSFLCVHFPWSSGS